MYFVVSQKINRQKKYPKKRNNKQIKRHPPFLLLFFCCFCCSVTLLFCFSNPTALNRCPSDNIHIVGMTPQKKTRCIPHRYFLEYCYSVGCWWLKFQGIGWLGSWSWRWSWSAHKRSPSRIWRRFWGSPKRTWQCPSTRCVNTAAANHAFLPFLVSLGEKQLLKFVQNCKYL